MQFIMDQMTGLIIVMQRVQWSNLNYCIRTGLLSKPTKAGRLRPDI
jgi:hypothetical protein